MLSVSRYEKVSPGGFRTFQEAIVVFIGGYGQAVFRVYENGDLSDAVKKNPDAFLLPRKLFASKDLCIFHEHIGRDTQRERPKESEFKDSRGGAFGSQ